MKFLQSFLLASLPIAGALASPQYADLLDQIQDKLSKRFSVSSWASWDSSVVVSSLASPVEVTGDHAFIAPNFTAGDQRGPCPGLNALANHGYIPRNGVVSLVEAVAAMEEVYGMGIDLATILAVMGTVWTGNPLSLEPSFSIGGVTPEVENLLGDLGGLLGTPQGLIGSHNFIEADSSLTRADMYMTGDNYKLQMNQFEEWYNMSNSTIGNFTTSVMALRAKNRFYESVAENPDFYYGPLCGFIARNAGYTFPRVMRNYSVEHPEGVLTKEIIKSFWAISGEEGNFVYTEGHESIPDNWYRSPVDYGLAGLLEDLIVFMTEYPELSNIGGNTGTVNSFTGLNLADVTGGVFNVETLLEGNNLLCFAFEVVKAVAPGALATIFEVVSTPLQLILDVLAQPILDLACPALSDLEAGGQDWLTGIQTLYPGANKSSGAL